jgi:hypothetical protein
MSFDTAALLLPGGHVTLPDALQGFNPLPSLTARAVRSMLGGKALRVQDSWLGRPSDYGDDRSFVDLHELDCEVVGYGDRTAP